MESMEWFQIYVNWLTGDYEYGQRIRLLMWDHIKSQYLITNCNLIKIAYLGFLEYKNNTANLKCDMAICVGAFERCMERTYESMLIECKSYCGFCIASR